MKISSLLPPLAIVALAMVGAIGSVNAIDVPLAEREGPRPQTTPGVPHVQIGVDVVPEIDAKLLEQVSRLPEVKVRPTVVSLPGAQGFWLSEELVLSHPEVIVGGREFAHLHPDGSLHASLLPERARESVAAGWATPHPWADQREGWEGFVMIYTPQSIEELEVVFQLIVDSYNFVTGRDLSADDFAIGP